MKLTKLRLPQQVVLRRNNRLTGNSYEIPFIMAPKKLLLYLLLPGFLGGVSPCLGQDTLLLSYPDYYHLVVDNHPVIRQSNLIQESAQSELLMARGGFDPKLQGSFDRKVYKSKEYFNRGDVFLKVPVWLAGADLKIGYDRNVGETLSDDVRTGPEGISYIGLTVPIGQGFLIDSRRITLRQAHLFQDMADAERIKMINKLVLTITKDYWNWYFAYQQYRLTLDYATLAEVRYEAIRQRTRLGESAPIDTVEAWVTLLDRQNLLQQALLELRNARLVLSNHLWDNQQQPRELPEEILPQIAANRVIGPDLLERLTEQARRQHPELLKFNLKQQQLQLDERLNRDLLKPTLNLEMAALYKGFSLNGSETNTGLPYLSNNYKFMVDLYFPLFLRKERGKLQLIRIKQLQNDLELQQASREISNEIRLAYNDIKNLEHQISTQLRVITGQEVLLRAELEKFSLGESSLFLINAREAKLNELRIKLQSLQSKYEKALATLLFAAGVSTWDTL
jgi:outer membrane protein TolC